jgi:uncharacterized membrane protein YkoI
VRSAGSRSGDTAAKTWTVDFDDVRQDTTPGQRLHIRLSSASNPSWVGFWQHRPPEVVGMRMTVRVLVVAVGTVLFIAGGLSPEHATDTRSETARAATVVRIERVQVRQPSASEQARQAAEAAVSGATAREVEREADGDGNRGSAYEVELVRPNGSTVEVDLDAGFKVLATDHDDRREN